MKVLEFLKSKKALLVVPVIVAGAAFVGFSGDSQLSSETTGENYTENVPSEIVNLGTAEGVEANDSGQAPEQSGNSTTPTQPVAGPNETEQPAPTEPEPEPEQPPVVIKVTSIKVRFEPLDTYAFRARGVAPEGTEFKEQYCDYTYSDGTKSSRFVGIVARPTSTGGPSAVGDIGC